MQGVHQTMGGVQERSTFMSIRFCRVCNSFTSLKRQIICEWESVKTRRRTSCTIRHILQRSQEAHCCRLLNIVSSVIKKQRFCFPFIRALCKRNGGLYKLSQHSTTNTIHSLVMIDYIYAYILHCVLISVTFSVVERRFNVMFAPNDLLC